MRKLLVILFIPFSIISMVNYQSFDFSFRRIRNISEVKVVKSPKGFWIGDSVTIGNNIYILGSRIAEDREVILVYSKREQKIVREIALGDVKVEKSEIVGGLAEPHIASLPDGRLVVVNRNIIIPKTRIFYESGRITTIQEPIYFAEFLILNKNGETEKRWLIPYKFYGKPNWIDEKVIGIETTPDGHIIIGFCDRDKLLDEENPHVEFLIYDSESNYISSFSVSLEGRYRDRICFTLDPENNIALLAINSFNVINLYKFDINGKYEENIELEKEILNFFDLGPAMGVRISPDGNIVVGFYTGEVFIFNSEGRLINEIEIPQDIYGLEVDGKDWVVLIREEGK